MPRFYALAGLLLVIPACSTAEGDTDGDGTGSTGQTADSNDTALSTSSTTTGSSATSTSSGTTDPGTSSPTMSTSATSSFPTDGSGDSTAAETEGCPFVCETESGDPGDCDLFLQDCPRGEKCTAWANDGGNSWNDTRCVPVDPDPDAVGESCTAEESGVSGIDSCELGALCWDVDPKTLEGECIAFCGGSVNDPTCEGGCEYCSIAGEGVLSLCLPTCDPLNPQCGDGEGCVAVNNRFTCVPLAEETAGVGETCVTINDCDAGLSCVAGDNVTGCTPGEGCCTAFCDLDDVEACADQAGNTCLEASGKQPERCGGGAGLCATAE